LLVTKPNQVALRIGTVRSVTVTAGLIGIGFGVFCLARPRVGPSRLAERLSVSGDDVIQGLEVGRAYSTDSIDPLVDPDEDASTLAAVVGRIDPSFERVEDRHALRPLVTALPDRESRSLEMRFFRNMTQTELADELGISQMHVSRLLTQTLARLRDQLMVEG